MAWRRGASRVLLWTALVLVVLPAVWLVYELSRGSRNPFSSSARRGEALLRHVGILPKEGWGAYESASYSGWTGPSERKTSETLYTREPVYALGLWPTGMHYSVREVSYDGPLDFTGLRLVWWNRGERHVVDTADRANGRLPAGATSVEVHGWIPFEAGAYGVEDIGTTFSPGEWRMRRLSGDKDR
jgi:hypothetical protein